MVVVKVGLWWWWWVVFVVYIRGGGGSMFVGCVCGLCSCLWSVSVDSGGGCGSQWRWLGFWVCLLFFRIFK